jgi:hypothetical protein
MNYLERYRNGEYEQVWDELRALGPAVRDEPHYSQAREVAAETMRRVRRNCELLVTRLRSLGYIFGTYPDGSTGYYTEGPLVPLTDANRAEMFELEEEAGPLPLSLVAFWKEVGSVDFVGMHPDWPNGLDPLVVIPPEGALSLLYEEDGDDESTKWFAGLSPDDIHKDNESGGDPYGVALPNSSADFEFVGECHNLPFVSYLRMAILRWGGLPGLDHSSVEVEPLAELVAGLEPF